MVHVWRAALDVEPTLVDALARTLSTDERARADRYVFLRDRERFIVARGILRVLLGRYLAFEPARLRFAYGAQGKPRLHPCHVGDDLRFNVAHSGGLALVAISPGRELGVDIERIDPQRVDGALADRFFSPREVAALRALPVAERPSAFFACWTRKEAFIKARGEGLALGLDGFDVSLGLDEPAVALRVAGDPREAGRWSLRNLPVTPGYAAALAGEGQGWRIELGQWSARPPQGASSACT